MYLTGHAAVGATIALAVTTNPVVAFGVGILSHYLADFVPHGDEDWSKWIKKGDEVKRLFVIASVDGIVLLSILIAYIMHVGWSWVFIAGAVGSLVPDVMWGLEKLLKRKLFGPHEAFHLKNHNFMKIHLSLVGGFIAQGIVATLLWWHLFT